jgi:hypothetical protein
MAHSFVRLAELADPTLTAEFPEFAALPAVFRRGTAREYGVELRHGQLWHRESTGASASSVPATSVPASSVPAKSVPATSVDSPRPDSPRFQAQRSESMSAAYTQSEPIAFAIGSGRRGRSYVLNRDGWLTLSPISWYATEQRWDLSPEYDPESHPRFDRPVADRCLQCHAGRVEPAATMSSRSYNTDKAGNPSAAPATSSSDKTGPAQLATGDVIRYAPHVATELAIGCERCHGPGARHVAKHSNGLASAVSPAGSPAKSLTKSTAADDSICNPSRLPADRADDVCNQCHLSSAAQVLRYGRRHGDFRPGDRLDDIWLTFDDGPPTPPTDTGGPMQAVSHVAQARASRCYQGTNGELRCVSCHDPHEVPDARSRSEFFDNKCLACHANDPCSLPANERVAPPANGSCIGCHMPRLPAADVPHTTQTDHRILRRPLPGAGRTHSPLTHSPLTHSPLAHSPLTQLPLTHSPLAHSPLAQLPLAHSPPSNSPPFQSPPAQSPPFQSPPFQSLVGRPEFAGVPAWELQRARALLAARRAEQERSPALGRQVLQQLIPLSPVVLVDADLLDARAICRLLDGQRAAAIDDWERLLALDPERHSALQSLLTLQMETGETTRAMGYAERLMALQPHQADVLLRYAVLAERQGRFEQAAEAIERAWRLNPASAAIRERRAAARGWAVPTNPSEPHDNR